MPVLVVADAINLTNVNGTLFFTANDGQLWKSDGTASGTTLVTEIVSQGPYAVSPSFLTNVNGTLFFRANDGVTGYELWKSDGTASGTLRVKDIRPGSSNASPRDLTNVDGTLFFTADDGVNGRELWQSDGTSSGTVLVKDIQAGSSSAIGYQPSLMNVNGTLFFSANDGVHGEELWQSDGTEAGTVLVEDLTGDAGGSKPGSITLVGDRLFVAATNAVFGRELWTGILGTRQGDFDRNGALELADIDVLVAAIAEGNNPLAYDLTNDAQVDGQDLDPWLQLAGAANLGAGRSYLPGDANLDGVVNAQDFITWNTNKFTSVAAWSKGDFNADGVVDGQDFIVWNTNKFTSSAGRGSERDSRQVVAYSGLVHSRQEADVDRHTLKKRQLDVDAVFALLENDRLHA